jgi:thiol-disulfide isomerase/thioredoxin
MRNLFKMTIKWTLPALLYALVGTSLAVAQEIPLGSQMPMGDQGLADVAGGNKSLGSLRGSKGTVVAFWSNQCPWIDKYQERVLALANTFKSQGIGFVFVNANDAAAYPKESVEESRAKGYPVTYLMDGTSALAKAFGAERTPHVYVFDATGTLVYVGTVDDSPGDPGNVQKQYLRDALTAVVQGSPVAVPQTKAFGCMIRFKN